MDGARHEASRLATSIAMSAIGMRTSTGSTTTTSGTPTVVFSSETRLTFSRPLQREFSFQDTIAILQAFCSPQPRDSLYAYTVHS